MDVSAVGAARSGWGDPIHGRITLPQHQWADDIVSISQTRPVRRLQNIKQLGFGWLVYPMATHTRFSHAIGSMHVAGQLYSRCSFGPEELTKFVELYSPRRSAASHGTYLLGHVMAAALLQDIGELPYAPALDHIFTPSIELRRDLADWAETETALSDKQWFTLAGIQQLDREGQFRHLDPFLVAQIACRPLARIEADDTGILEVLRNIVDSPIDADRIDYVYRDAYCTIGSLGNPEQTIAAISNYGKHNATISSPPEIGAFLSNRTSLYRAVYMEPTKRLQEHALRVVLNETAARDLPLRIKGVTVGAVSLEEFYLLNDPAVEDFMYEVAQSDGLRRLSANAQRAAKTLTQSGAVSYRPVWVTSPENPKDGDEALAGIIADSDSDYSRALLTDSSFMRIDTSKFIGAPEDSILDWLPELWTQARTRRPRSILCFVPNDLDAAERRRLSSLTKSGGLYLALRTQLMMRDLGCPSDTRSDPGFRGPAVHISFCWDDVQQVRRLVKQMHRNRIQYYLLLDPFDGFGTSTKENSRNLISTAPRVLVVLSAAYLSRYHSQPNGNIAAEINELHARYARNDGPPTSFVLAEPGAEILDGFPWAAVGRDEPPYVGQSLSACLDDDIAALVSHLAEGARRP